VTQRLLLKELSRYRIGILFPQIALFLPQALMK
jgi:hypothetical protein